MDTAATAAARKAVPAAAGDVARPGGLGVRVRAGVDSADGQARTPGEARSQLAGPPSSVRVRVWDRSLATSVGINGVVFSLSRADGKAGVGRVALDVDYSTFEHMSGADFGARLRLVSLPGCVLDSPELPQCMRPSLIAEALNVETEKVVSVDGLDVGAASDASSPNMRASSKSGERVFALTSGGASSTGDFTKTPLSPSFSWNAGEQSGGFSTSIPITVPPGLGGPVPDVRLTYSSASVDTMTIATNSQASWVGTGWDLSLGSIDRSYASCATDGMANGDLCWKSASGQIADVPTLTLNGTSTRLVRNDTNGVWRAEDDTALRIEQLWGGLNNSTKGEYWRVTTLDGTQYYFGVSRRPAVGMSDRDTLSAQVVPVYSNNSGEHCYDESGHWCYEVYRWNLDWVVDPRGNSMRIFYSKPAGGYWRNNGQAYNYYEIAAYPNIIEYGYRADDPWTSTGQMRVEFVTNNRCTPADGCQADVPWDLYCNPPAPGVTPTCSQTSPAFFMQQGLAQIATKIWDNAAGVYRTVDTYDLVEKYPDPGDGTTPSLWLSYLTHTGYNGADHASDPTLEFWGDLRDNRVDYNTGAGVPPLRKYRLGYIIDNTGSKTLITYLAGDCTAATLPDPDQNPKRCFPQYFSLTGSPPGWGWFHKYIVSAVTVQDLTDVNSVDEVWNYAYSTQGSSTSVLWGHNNTEMVPLANRSWSVFRGYSTVTTTHGAAGGTQTVSSKRYFRGLWGDRTDAGEGARSSTIMDSFGNAFDDVLSLAGRVREDMTIDSGAIIGSVLHDLTPAVTAARTRTYQGGNITANYVWETRTQTKTKINATNSWRSTDVQTSYDGYALAYQVINLGDTATTNDDVCTGTEYARNPTAYVIATPSQVTTRAGGACTTGTLLGQSRTYYDGSTTLGAAPSQALATKSDTLVATGPDVWAATEAGYDMYGRPTSSKDARGKTSTITYTPATVLPATQIAAANPLAQTVTTTIDPRRGQPTTIADANGKTTTGLYDPLGRLTKVWRPGQPTSGTPNVEYSYTVAATGSSVASKVLGPTGNQITVYDLFDGRLRLRQTQQPAPQANGGRIIADTAYDSRGLTVKTSTLWNSTAPGATLVTFADADVPTQNRTVYDQQARITNDQLWSNNVLKWETTTSYDGDRVMITPPAGGIPTTTFTNAAGRTIELRQHLGTTTAAPYQATTYAFDRLDRLTGMTDPAGNTWTTSYDTGGRTTASTDPDKGNTTFTYNAAGDLLTSTVVGRSITLSYKYDDLGRKAELWQGAVGTGTKRATWDYDATLPSGDAMKGHPVKSTRWVPNSGGVLEAYSSEVTDVDDSYRPLKNKVSLPASMGTLTGPWTTETTYTPNGQVATQILPAAGSLPAETITYSYDNTGRPLTMAGTDAYISGTAYYNWGDVYQTTMGAGTKRVQVQNTVDEATRRSTEKRVSTENQTTPGNWVPQLIEQYSYDNAGNVKNINEVDGSGSTVSNQCFKYDALRQLAEAWTTTAATCQATPTQAVVGGPDPYWTSYTYNTIGNRSTDTVHTPGGDTVRTYAYPASGATSVRPHAANGVTIAGLNPGSDSYAYDGAGNTTTRSLAGKPSQTLTWDPEGHLASVTDSGGTTSYIYTPDGQRLLAYEPGSATTLYLDGYELRRTTTGVTCTRHYGVAARSTSGGLTWTTADHHNTGQAAINPTTLAVTRRKTDPYGNTRGPAAAWPTTRGFVNGIQDPTGLTHLGAREYEPAAGRFISVDPIMNLADPTQWNGYTYANNTPTTGSDSNGLCTRLDEHSGPCVGSSIIGYTGDHGPVNSNLSRPKPCPIPGACNKRPEPAEQTPGQNWGHGDEDGYGNQVGGYTYDGGPDPAQLAYAADKYYDKYRATESNPYMATLLAIRAACAEAKYVQCDFTFIDAVTTTYGLLDNARNPDCSARCQKLAADLVGYGDVVSEFGEGIRAGRSGGGASPRSCNSFDPDTLVLMADGSTKAIKDVKVGDYVLATDPTTGRSGTHRVVAQFSNIDSYLTIVFVDTPTGANRIRTTPGHRLFSKTEKTWLRADSLSPKDRLLALGGSAVVLGGTGAVGAIRMYDLSVEDVHTYYVLAGDTPILVHNSPCDAHGWTSQGNLDAHYERHGRDMGFESPVEYEYAAEDLMCMCDRRPGVLVRQDGNTRYYLDPETGEFGVTSDRGIVTYYIPDDPMAHFNSQPGALIP